MERTFNRNFLLMSDSYKLTHWKMYQPDIEYVYSYLESRGYDGNLGIPADLFQGSLFFGLQYYLKEYLQGRVFDQADIEEAEAVADRHFGIKGYFNREGWEYILREYEGRLPIEIHAVPEGSVVQTHNALLTIQNTDPKVPWLTNVVETLLMKLWYPITVGTLSWHIRQLIQKYARQTGCENIQFHLHDFGYRGVSSEESAGIGDAAHLINFEGTDTIAGIMHLIKYYPTAAANLFPAYSVAAAEHSTVTSWGRDSEQEAYLTALINFPEGILSLVCDSYDTERAVREMFGGTLKDSVMERKGKLVARPDSGHPPKMSLAVLEGLWEKFGGTTNEKGYRVLDPHVGCIYGDGINYRMINSILKTITDAKFCVSNIVFGMGGALLQQLDRDSLKFALKCSAVYRSGRWHDVWKAPVTDRTKASKRGRLIVRREPGTNDYRTYRLEDTQPISHPEVMNMVFRNGDLNMKVGYFGVRQNAREAEEYLSNLPK